MNLDLIRKWEGCKLEAYICPAGIVTIGYGNTYDLNGNKIKMGQKITQKEAEELLNTLVNDYIKCVKNNVTSVINDNQMSALVSFVWNVGCANFKNSTLLKLINKNPNDPTIRLEFNKWNKVNKVAVKGLTNRRKDEADTYFLK